MSHATPGWLLHKAGHRDARTLLHARSWAVGHSWGRFQCWQQQQQLAAQGADRWRPPAWQLHTLRAPCALLSITCCCCCQHPPPCRHEVDIYEGRQWVGGKVASFTDKDGNHIEVCAGFACVCEGMAVGWKHTLALAGRVVGR